MLDYRSLAQKENNVSNLKQTLYKNYKKLNSSLYH